MPSASLWRSGENISGCVSLIHSVRYEIRGESVKHIRFDDDGMGGSVGQLQRTLIPLQLSSLHPVLSGSSGSTRGRHFLVVCCENKDIFFDLSTVRARQTNPGKQSDASSWVMPVWSFFYASLVELAHDGGVHGTLYYCTKISFLSSQFVFAVNVHLTFSFTVQVVRLAPFHAAPSSSRPPPDQTDVDVEDKKQYPDHLWSTSVLESETASFGLLTGSWFIHRCLAAHGDVSAVKWAFRLGREHHDWTTLLSLC
ncbi:hypothetical protein SELMODRAFT_426615 [Selaginella moellendorffii]|uniref:Uncharacterized protein n=1 Tax=Selaginella moellendorffii TaxID=88036 RepID=D8SWY3_SELML|nr:hypothetical protein SELMODRAFT_426615 [Selaginella moellendorffii]